MDLHFSSRVSDCGQSCIFSCACLQPEGDLFLFFDEVCRCDSLLCATGNSWNTTNYVLRTVAAQTPYAYVVITEVSSQECLSKSVMPRVVPQLSRNSLNHQPMHAADPTCECQTVKKHLYQVIWLERLIVSWQQPTNVETRSRYLHCMKAQKRSRSGTNKTQAEKGKVEKQLQRHPSTCSEAM